MGFVVGLIVGFVLGALAIIALAALHFAGDQDDTDQAGA